MEWWSWCILGVVLLGIELFAVDAQFYLVFAGLAAIVVGLLGLVGIDLPVWAQWISFTVLAVATVFTVRKQIYALLMNKPSLGKISTDLDQRIVVDSGACARQVLPYRIPWQRLDGGQRRRAADRGGRPGAHRLDRRPHVTRARAVSHNE